MPDGVDEIALYASYTPDASPPAWLEAAPSLDAHNELEALRTEARL